MTRRGTAGLPGGILPDPDDTIIPYQVFDDLHEDAWLLVNELAPIEGECMPQEFEEAEQLRTQVWDEITRTEGNIIPFPSPPSKRRDN